MGKPFKKTVTSGDSVIFPKNAFVLRHGSFLIARFLEWYMIAGERKLRCDIIDRNGEREINSWICDERKSEFETIEETRLVAQCLGLDPIEIDFTPSFIWLGRGEIVPLFPRPEREGNISEPGNSRNA